MIHASVSIASPLSLWVGDEVMFGRVEPLVGVETHEFFSSFDCSAVITLSDMTGSVSSVVPFADLGDGFDGVFGALLSPSLLSPQLLWLLARCVRTLVEWSVSRTERSGLSIGLEAETESVSNFSA